MRLYCLFQDRMTHMMMLELLYHKPRTTHNPEFEELWTNTPRLRVRVVRKMSYK